MFYFNVRIQVWALSKLLITIATRKRFFTSVHPMMKFHTLFIHSMVVTNETYELVFNIGSLNPTARSTMLNKVILRYYMVTVTTRNPAWKENIIYIITSLDPLLMKYRALSRQHVEISTNHSKTCNGNHWNIKSQSLH